MILLEETVDPIWLSLDIMLYSYCIMKRDIERLYQQICSPQVLQISLV